MPDFHEYLSDATAIPAFMRPVQAWNRIKHKPTDVTLKRLGTPQTVRLEYSSNAGERNGPSGEASVRALTLFGVRDHPDISVIDTDIRRGDRFVFNLAEYQVIAVVVTVGEIQANCKVIE